MQKIKIVGKVASLLLYWHDKLGCVIQICRVEIEFGFYWSVAAAQYGHLLKQSRFKKPLDKRHSNYIKLNSTFVGWPITLYVWTNITLCY